MKEGYKIDIDGNKTIIPDGCKEVYCDLYLADTYFDEWLINDVTIRFYMKNM